MVRLSSLHALVRVVWAQASFIRNPSIEEELLALASKCVVGVSCFGWNIDETVIALTKFNAQSLDSAISSTFPPSGISKFSVSLADDSSSGIPVDATSDTVSEAG